MVAEHSVNIMISWEVYFEIRSENVGMSNDKQWKKHCHRKSKVF
jgi:hypothetical protein